MNAPSAIAQLRAQLAITRGDPPPPPPPPTAPENLTILPFSFATPTQVLMAYAAGTVFSFAGVLLSTPFNAPSSLRVGSSADPSMLIDAPLMYDCDLQSDAIVVAGVGDVLMLTMNPGAASLGAGYVFFRARTP